MTGFTVYQPYLISIGGLTNAQASMLTSIRSLFTLLAMFAVNRILRKTDIRMGATYSVLAIVLSFLIYGMASSFSVYAMAAATAGFAYGVGGMVAATIMINRWFVDYQGLALGICAAGSGVSTVIATPIITVMIEKFSMKATLIGESIVVAIFAIPVFVLLRNRPKGEEDKHFGGNNPTAKPEGPVFRVSKSGSHIVCVSILIMGFTYAASSHISVVCKSEGFHTQTVALLISVMGIALVVGKCVYGLISDKFGSFVAGNLFFGGFFTGVALCCISGLQNTAIAIVSVALLGAGSSILSVGISVIARAVAAPIHFTPLVQKFQIIYMIGSLIFGVVPGMMADRMGSYIPAYVVLTVLVGVSAVMVQSVLWKQEKGA